MVTQEQYETAFERAPELLARFAGRPYETVDEVIAAAARIIAELPERERIAVLDAHPRIGADPARLSALSYREQRGAEDVDERTQREVARLNDEYEAKFGFRFVTFVNGRTKREIMPELRRRLDNSRADELARGISEFLAIARARLETDKQ